MKKKKILKYIEICKEIEENTRSCEKVVDGLEGYAPKAEVFWKISKEMGFLEDDLVDLEEQVEELKEAFYQLMAWSGRWFDPRYDPLRLVDIKGIPRLYFAKDIFQDCYGETDVERVLTSRALYFGRYPISEYVQDEAGYFGFDLREEYLSKVDKETLEQFGGHEEVPSVSSSVLPRCLKEEGLKVLTIGMDGCPPCKVVDKAVEAIEDELEDVSFFKRMFGDKDISGLVEEFNIFGAPALFFSDGKNILVHMGGSKHVEDQAEYIRSVIGAVGEVEYDPFLRKGIVTLDHGPAAFVMKVIK